MGCNGGRLVCDFISDTRVGPGRSCSGTHRPAQTVKYEKLARNHIFASLVCEVTGEWCQEAVEIFQELGRCISVVTGDKRETSFLFQRISIALRRVNAACMLGSFPIPLDPVSD